MRKIFLYNESVAPAMVEYDRTKLASLFPRATFIELGRLFAYRRSLESTETQSVIEMYRTDKVSVSLFRVKRDTRLGTMRAQFGDLSKGYGEIYRNDSFERAFPGNAKTKKTKVTSTIWLPFEDE
jgi:hypothetical protein